MNWIEFIKTNGQYIVPVIGFLGAVFMYVAHDRTLKNLQIKQLKEEQDKKKQADIKCNAYRSKSNSIVKIVNAGPADASNIRVEILDKDKLEGLIFFHRKPLQEYGGAYAGAVPGGKTLDACDPERLGVLHG